MNSFTRIGLPILLVVGAVFLITMATTYNTDPDTTVPDPAAPPGKNGPVKAAREEPLHFFTKMAAAPKTDRTPEPLKKDKADLMPENLKHTKYWSPEVEIDQPGYYVYWAANKHPLPVAIRATGTSCTCASLEYAVIPPAALRDFTALAGLAGSPLISSPMPFTAALAQVALARQLDWQPLYSKDNGMTPGEVPAAGPAGPQLIAVRMNFSGKPPEGSRSIMGEVIATLPDAPPAATRLEAAIHIVPSFTLMKRAGNTWEVANELDLGELRENGVSRQEFFAVSANRLYLSPVGSLATGDHPCIRISPAAPATAEEIQSLQQYAPKADEPPLMPRVASMYKMSVTVRERVAAGQDGQAEARQMDLGLLDRRLNVENGAGGDAKTLLLRGRVFGDVRILAGADSGRIDLGNGFPVDQDHGKAVTLIADRANLDVTLLPKETRPNYLKVKLDPQKDIDGRKNWRLTVTVPKGTLYGALPETAVIMLATGETPPRLIRLPIRGASYDSGDGR